MTTTDYLSLSPEDRTKFFCESCGIEPHNENALSAFVGPYRAAAMIQYIGKYPRLTLDFLFEWAKREQNSTFVHLLADGRYAAKFGRIGEGRSYAENESPTLALQLAILKFKGAITE